MPKHTIHVRWGITLGVILIMILTGCAVPNASSPADSSGSANGSTGETLNAAPTSAAAGSTTASTAPADTATTGSANAGSAGDAATANPTDSSSPQATSGIQNSGTSGDIQYVIVPDKSEANYRVREQLVNKDLPNDAIGKTNQISGAISVKPDGTIDSANSKITVDVTNLKSDRDMRDNFVRRNVLNTDQYPQVVFVPTQISGLPSPLPQSGAVSFKVTGNLTVRDVTKPVTWDVTGTVNGDQATGKASTSFTFEDFNLSQPRVPVVLSLEDHITLEVNVTLQKSAGATSSTDNSASTAGATAASIPATGANTPEAATSGSNAPEAAATNANTSVAVAPTCTSPAALTPAVTEGPYFKAGSPEQANLVQQGMGGTKLTLSGYVLSADCKPIPHALIDFWQADAQGQYDNSGYTLRGHQYTDSSGRYQLVTVIPGLYPGRTEHIHVKVQPPNGAVLTTQLFFPDVSQNQRDGIFDAHLLVNLQDAPDGKQATFNFVVK